jgi:MFS transporter, PPP family, 3-phenylpropionic acid transporter
MRIAFFYFVYFGAVGVMLPYLPPHLRAMGFSGTEIGALLAVAPLLMIVVPPLWGFFADRARSTAAVLKLACLGSALAFAPLLGAKSFFAVAAVLTVHALFYTPITALADTVAVAHVRAHGGDYARLRLWGSVGFVITSFAFSAHLAHRGSAADVVWVTLALFGVAAAAATSIRSLGATALRPSLSDARRLARDPAFLAFLVAGGLHWAAAAPFHLLFAVHLEDLGADPRWIGAGLALAVGAEVAVMWRFPALRRRLSLFGLLQLVFVASAARWLLTAWAPSGAMAAALQVLHGLTFGAFFVAAIVHLQDTVPERLRATGRALFSSVVFGLGGVGGNALAGALYDLGGASLAFAAAAGLQLCALPCLAWAARLRDRSTDSA